MSKIKQIILDSKLEKQDYNRALEALLKVINISSGERRQDLQAYAELCKLRIKEKLAEEFGEKAIYGRVRQYQLEPEEQSD